MNEPFVMHDYCYVRDIITAVQWNGSNLDNILEFLERIEDDESIKFTLEMGDRTLKVRYGNQNVNIMRGSFIIFEDGELKEIDAMTMNEVTIRLT